MNVYKYFCLKTNLSTWIKDPSVKYYFLQPSEQYQRLKVTYTRLLFVQYFMLAFTLDKMTSLIKSMEFDFHCKIFYFFLHISETKVNY